MYIQHISVIQNVMLFTYDSIPDYRIVLFTCGSQDLLQEREDWSKNQ